MFQPSRLLIIGLLLLFSACTGSSGDSFDSSVETAAAETVSDGGTSPTKSEGTSRFAPHIQTVSTLTNCLFLHNRWVSAVAFHKVFTEKRDLAGMREASAYMDAVDDRMKKVCDAYQSPRRSTQ